MPNRYEIRVRRNNLLLDSYRSVTVANPELLKTRLWIVFDSETGVDYGGLQRYCLLIFYEFSHSLLLRKVK